MRFEQVGESSVRFYIAQRLFYDQRVSDFLEGMGVKDLYEGLVEMTMSQRKRWDAWTERNKIEWRV